MSELVESEQWVYVVVQDPSGQAQFLGQHDEERGESFIPLFLEKEEAQKALGFLKRMEELEYEVQAILYEDLFQRAAESGVGLFVLKGTGEILEKIDTGGAS